MQKMAKLGRMEPHKVTEVSQVIMRVRIWKLPRGQNEETKFERKFYYRGKIHDRV